MSGHLVLRQSELDALLAWLAPGRDQAGEEYEIIRQRLLRYFQGRHCIPADEHVDETIDRVARRVAAGERIQCADPIRYCYGVAKNVFLEYLKHQAALLRRGGTFSLPDSTPSPHLLCLNRCLNSLTPCGRELIEAYYLDSRQGLAAREGISPNALRIRVFKEKQKLRECLRCCLQLHPL